MSDLNIAPDESHNPLKGILIAVGVLIAISIAVFALNPHETGVLTVTDVQTFAPRVEFQGMASSSGSRVMNSSVEDNLYVVATVHLENKLRLPIFISYSGGVLTLTDGSEVTANVISTNDMPNLEQTFPALLPMLPHPLLDGAQASPGGSLEGQVLLLFPAGTQKTWDTKKSATLTLYLAHQDPISVTLK